VLACASQVMMIDVRVVCVATNRQHIPHLALPLQFHTFTSPDRPRSLRGACPVPQDRHHAKHVLHYWCPPSMWNEHLLTTFWLPADNLNSNITVDRCEPERRGRHRTRRRAAFVQRAALGGRHCSDRRGGGVGRKGGASKAAAAAGCAVPCNAGGAGGAIFGALGCCGLAAALSYISRFVWGVGAVGTRLLKLQLAALFLAMPAGTKRSAWLTPQPAASHPTSPNRTRIPCVPCTGLAGDCGEQSVAAPAAGRPAGGAERGAADAAAAPDTV
jgi:hypothetical protein